MMLRELVAAAVVAGAGFGGCGTDVVHGGPDCTEAHAPVLVNRPARVHSTMEGRFWFRCTTAPRWAEVTVSVQYQQPPRKIGGFRDWGRPTGGKRFVPVVDVTYPFRVSAVCLPGRWRLRIQVDGYSAPVNGNDAGGPWPGTVQFWPHKWGMLVRPCKKGTG